MDDQILPPKHPDDQPLPPKDKVDEVIDERTLDDNLNEPAEKPSEHKSVAHKKSLKQRLKSLSKKQWAIIVIVLLLIIGAGIYAYETWFNIPKLKQGTAIIIAPKPVPTTVPSTLTGLPVAPSVNQIPVTAVMIENSTFARPQSGLDQAGVVFEAIAEGGITRFVALYQDTAPSYIGPVRSVRPYYLEWLLGFDAAVAHVGGSPEGLQDVTLWGVHDMNEFYNSSAFQRISSRAAPHNDYTSIAQLNALEKAKGFTSTFTGFPRKTDQPSKTPTAATINLNISSAYYNVQYQYNASTNTYKRSEGGAPHMEVNQAGAQTQIAPKVVVAMIVPLSRGPLDGIGAYYSYYATIGSGSVYVFQDGTVTTGTWSKTNSAQQITFTNASGAPIKLNAGQTWLTALSSTGQVSYTK